jgi:hypothetical protein
MKQSELAIVRDSHIGDSGESREPVVMDSGSGLGRTLQAALSLSEGDQLQLLAVLMRIHRLAPDTKAPQEITAEPVALASQVSDWLAQYATEPAWVQLRAIDGALEEATEPDELAVLRDAREALMKASPGVAVRANVEGYAREHPVATFGGLAGLLLAAFGFVRGLFHLVF